MSRLALRFAHPRPQLPIDPQGFPVVIHPTCWSAEATGAMVFAAMDPQGVGLIVEDSDALNDVRRYASANLPFLLGMLAAAGFDDVQVSPERPQVTVVYWRDAFPEGSRDRSQTYTCRFASFEVALTIPPPDGFTGAFLRTADQELRFRASCGWQRQASAAEKSPGFSARA